MVAAKYKLEAVSEIADWRSPMACFPALHKALRHVSESSTLSCGLHVGLRLQPAQESCSTLLTCCSL